jgi:hypothetical protein
LVHHADVPFHYLSPPVTLQSQYRQRTDKLPLPSIHCHLVDTKEWDSIRFENASETSV